MAAAAKLTAEAVSETLKRCLFREDEPENNEPGSDDYPVKVEAITGTFGFHRDRLEAHREQVLSWLNELPLEFLTGSTGGGGGWTFLNLCNRRDGTQWTGLHSTMQELCALAIGLGLAHWLMPRDMWDVLPGGMPYVQFSAVPSTQSAAA